MKRSDRKRIQEAIENSERISALLKEVLRDSGGVSTLDEEDPEGGSNPGPPPPPPPGP